MRSRDFHLVFTWCYGVSYGLHVRNIVQQVDMRELYCVIWWQRLDIYIILYTLLVVSDRETADNNFQDKERSAVAKAKFQNKNS